MVTQWHHSDTLNMLIMCSSKDVQIEYTSMLLTLAQTARPLFDVHAFARL